MSAKWAATFIIIGVVALAISILIWKKRKEDHWRKVSFAMVVAGVFLGAGIGYAAQIQVIDYKFGYIPAWMAIAAVVAVAFVLEVRGWNDHPTRTPILGFATALIIMLAAGNLVVGSIGQQIQNHGGVRLIQQTGKVTPASQKPKG